MEKQSQTGSPELTPRIYALLHAIRYRRLPWLKPGQGFTFNCVWRESPDRWVLCESHIYTDAEISAIELAGWITIAKTRSPPDQSVIKRGPKIGAALKQAFENRAQLSFPEYQDSKATRSLNRLRDMRAGTPIDLNKA